MRDIISIGDCTIDAFVNLAEASVQCDINHERCTICLDFANKIPIKERVRRLPAGNANNNAVGSARLGLKTALYTVVGDDENAAIILKNLQREGVETSLVQHDPENGTNFHVVLSYGPERTILIYHEEYEYRLPPLETRWAYFSSVGKKGAEPLGEQVAAEVKEKGIKLGFNPGTFQLQLGRTGLQKILEVTEALFVNKQEAELLLERSGTPAELLAGLHGLGPRTVVVTDGPAGSYASDGKEALFVPMYEALPAVERTGAGDAYATAFLAALISGESLSEAMRWGTFNSGAVLGKIGPQEGLLTRPRLEKFLGEAPDFQPQPVGSGKKTSTSKTKEAV